MVAAMIGKKRECAKTMAFLPGLIMSLYVAIGSAAHIHTQEMYENLKEQLQPSYDPSDKRTWKQFICVRDCYKRCAQWFIDNLDRVDGKPIAHLLHPLMVLDLTFYCDASATGFSTFLISWELTEAQHEKSSTWRELHWLLAMLLECFKLLRGTCFRVCLDNANSVLWLGGKAPQTAFKFSCCSRTPEIQALIVRTLELGSEGNMQMEAYWVQHELNVRADYNSHLN
eukprot:3528329-Rhodomonas_salina.2